MCGCSFFAIVFFLNAQYSENKNYNWHIIEIIMATEPSAKRTKTSKKRRVLIKHKRQPGGCTGLSQI
jgi:hypothetical protein